MGRVVGLVVAALLLAGCSSSDEPAVDATPAPVPAGLDTGCPEATTALRFPEGDLPTGATRVRLCPGPPLIGRDGKPMMADIQGPRELLTEGVDDLIDFVNGTEAHEPTDCTADNGPDLAYWFGYPDGDWRAVQYGAYGCRTLRVGAELERAGGVEIANAFVNALTAQRTSRPLPRNRPNVPHCAGLPLTAGQSAMPGTPVQLASATLCFARSRHHYREADVSTALLARINAELLVGPTERPQRCGRINWRTVEGYSLWGDRAIYLIDHCGAVYPPYGAGLVPGGLEPDPVYITPALNRAIESQKYGPPIKLG